MDKRAIADSHRLEQSQMYESCESYNNDVENEYRVRCATQFGQDQETFANPYEHDESNGNLESQDIFNTANVVQEVAGHDQDNGDTDMGDCAAFSSIFDMGKECLELQQDIAQKSNDIAILKENSLSLKSEIENKQKALESAKLELLTEQDNYDSVQKKLDEEIERITTIGAMQEILNDRVKFFLEQKSKVQQFMTDFDKEFDEAKENCGKLMSLFKINEDTLQTILNTISEKKQQIAFAKMKVMEEKQEYEVQLKSKIDELEELISKVKIKECQQSAVLEYLKVKRDQEWANHEKLKLELQSIEDSACQQIDDEERECTVLEDRSQKTSDELIEIKSKVCTDKAQLEELISEKDNINDEIAKFQRKEGFCLQELSNCNNELSNIMSEIEQQKKTLEAKIAIKCLNENIKNDVEVLEETKLDILKKIDETDCTMSDMQSVYDNLKDKLSATVNDHIQIRVVKDNLSTQKLNLLHQFEQLKDDNESQINYLENEKTSFENFGNDLQNEIKQLENDIHYNQDILSTISTRNLQMKKELQDSDNTAISLCEKINEIKIEIIDKQKEFEIGMVSIKNEIREKEELRKNCLEKIKHYYKLQVQNEELVGEIEAINCKGKEEQENLKSSHALELQVKKNEFQEKKMELEALVDSKKMYVKELQEEMIDEQRKELHLIKSTHKLNHMKDEYKNRITELKKVVKTVDEKLKYIAQAVTSVNKEPAIVSQSTIVSSIPQKSSTTKTEADFNDNDSTSSGISIKGNNLAWKKKLMRKQQMKQQTKSQSSIATESVSQLWFEVVYLG